MIEKEKFERHLRGTNLSENTISSYLFAIKQYGEQYDDVTQKKLREYKVWLIENYKPKTVNLRLRAINCYLNVSGEVETPLCPSAAESFSGKCDQRSGLRIFQVMSQE